jgi:integrase
MIKNERPGPSTIAKCNRLLHAICETAVENSLIARNPCVIKGASVERPAERPVATIEQVFALADASNPAICRIVRKGGKRVTIPLAPRTARALDLYVGERTVGPVFVNATGGRMDRSAADRVVKRLGRRAGITKRISPHSLRHSFITAALDAGVPLRDVQEAASHADPRTTMRYDRGRQSLDRHATYVVAAFLAGASRQG